MNSVSLRRVAFIRRSLRKITTITSLAGNRTTDAPRNRRVTQMQRFYAEHVRHEELTIFPLAEESLSTTQMISIRVEMSARRGVSFSASE